MFVGAAGPQLTREDTGVTCDFELVAMFAIANVLIEEVAIVMFLLSRGL